MPPPLLTSQQLSYTAIKAILAIPNLSSFQLIYKFPLKLMLDELQGLASKWPVLENLMLSAESLFLEKDAFTLDLQVLLLCKILPHLHLLSIYMDASKAEIPSPSTPVIILTPLFHSQSDQIRRSVQIPPASHCILHG